MLPSYIIVPMSQNSPLSLERGLHILELLSQHQSMSFSEVSSAMQLPNTTITRLLTALTNLAYIKKNADGHYQHCKMFSAVESQQSVMESLRQCGLPSLQHMHAHLQNTALLLFWSGKQSICIERLIHNDSAPLHSPGHIITDHRFTPWGYFVTDPMKWLHKKIKPNNMPATALTKTSITKMLNTFDSQGYTYDLLKDRHRVAAPIYKSGALHGILLLGGTPLSLPLNQIDRAGKLMRSLADSCGQLLEPAKHLVKLR